MFRSADAAKNAVPLTLNLFVGLRNRGKSLNCELTFSNWLFTFFVFVNVPYLMEAFSGDLVLQVKGKFSWLIFSTSYVRPSSFCTKINETIPLYFFPFVLTSVFVKQVVA